MLFIFTAALVLISIIGFTVLLCVVPKPFTWKPLHLDVNMRSVCIWTCVSIIQHRTTRGLSLEINYRILQHENDMPGNADHRITFCLLSLSWTAEVERRKRFILKPFDADQAIYNGWNADVLLKRKWVFLLKCH